MPNSFLKNYLFGICMILFKMSFNLTQCFYKCYLKFWGPKKTYIALKALFTVFVFF